MTLADALALEDVAKESVQKSEYIRVRVTPAFREKLLSFVTRTGRTQSEIITAALTKLFTEDPK